MQGALVAGFDVPGGMFLRWVPYPTTLKWGYLSIFYDQTNNNQHHTGQAVQQNVRCYVETTTNALDGLKSCPTTFATSRPVEITQIVIQNGSMALLAQVFLYLSVFLEDTIVAAK